MGQNRSTVDVDLVTNGNVVTQNSDVLQACPLADGAVPADDGGLDPGMVLDTAVLQQDAALETHTVADDDVGANGDVGADAAVLANLRRGVDHDIASVDVGLRGGGEETRVLALQRREVEAGSGQKVLGLSDVHPETLEIEGVQAAVLADGREGLLLDRRGAELDALQDAGVEDVDTGVDAVADELDGLLDETVDSRGMAGLVHNDTVLGRLLDLCDNNCALLAVLLVELGELFEGVFAGDVGVENKEGRIILAQDGLGELQGAGSAKGLGLDGELDLDVVLRLVLRAPVNLVILVCYPRCVLTVFRASAMISGR